MIEEIKNKIINKLEEMESIEELKIIYTDLDSLAKGELTEEKTEELCSKFDVDRETLLEFANMEEHHVIYIESIKRKIYDLDRKALEIKREKEKADELLSIAINNRNANEEKKNALLNPEERLIAQITTNNLSEQLVSQFTNDIEDERNEENLEPESTGEMDETDMTDRILEEYESNISEVQSENLKLQETVDASEKKEQDDIVAGLVKSYEDINFNQNVDPVYFIDIFNDILDIEPQNMSYDNLCQFLKEQPKRKDYNKIIKYAQDYIDEIKKTYNENVRTLLEKIKINLEKYKVENKYELSDTPQWDARKARKYYAGQFAIMQIKLAIYALHGITIESIKGENGKSEWIVKKDGYELEKTPGLHRAMFAAKEKYIQLYPIKKEKELEAEPDGGSR